MPDLRPFRALTFDCYGTLIDWETGLLRILLPWAAEAGLPDALALASPSRGLQPARGAPRDPALRAAPAEAGGSEIAHPSDPLAERLLAAFGASEPIRESQGSDGAPGFMLYPDVLRLVMRDIVSQLLSGPDSPSPLPLPLGEIALGEGSLGEGGPSQTDRVRGLDAATISRITAAAAEALANSVGDWPAFPDTPAALRSLHRHCKLVIVSNVDRASFARTNEKLGVTFDAIITAEDVRSYKPNLAHFHRALETLRAMGIEKHQVLHVAQSLFHDHVPAKSLGLATCWVRRRRGRSPDGAAKLTDQAASVRPDIEVETLAELAEMFQRA